MAKIIEQLVAIKFSKLAKESESAGTVLVADEVITSIEQVAQELAGEGIIVENESFHGTAD